MLQLSHIHRILSQGSRFILLAFDPGQFGIVAGSVCTNLKDFENPASWKSVHGAWNDLLGGYLV